MTTPPAVETKSSTAEYLSSTVFMDGYGARGAKPRPFSPHAAYRNAMQAWAFAAMTLNADAAAGVPLRLYARRRGGPSATRKLYETRPVSARTLSYLAGGAKGIRPSAAVRQKVAAFAGELEEVIEPHPALAILNDPNGDDDGHELAIARFMDLQATGNAYVYVITSGLGTPASLQRMPPQYTHVKPNESRTGDRRVAGYVYGKNTAVETTFGADEVIHWKLYPSDTDPYYGKGWVEAAWKALGLHESKRTEDLAFKDNMSRPDWMLAVDGGDPKTLARLDSALRERHQGPQNVGKFLIAQGKMTAQALQWETKELGTPTRLIEEIATVSKVPVAILLANDATNAGSKTARIHWYRTGVRVLCLRDEQKLNQKWVSRFDGSEDYFLAYDHVSFEDEEAVRKSSIASLAGGQLTVNESRAEIGYGPVDGGEQRYMPSGTTGTAAGVVGDLAVSPVVGVAGDGTTTAGVTGADVPDPTEALKAKADAYGVLVRAGVITAQPADENDFRAALGLPPMSAEATAAWATDKGVHRPITITPPHGDAPPAPQTATTPDDGTEDTNP